MGWAGVVGVSSAAVVGEGIGRGDRGYVMSLMHDEWGYLWGENVCIAKRAICRTTALGGINLVEEVYISMCFLAECKLHSHSASQAFAFPISAATSTIAMLISKPLASPSRP